MPDRTLWWVPFYPFAALGLWAIGVWFLAHELGVGIQDLFVSTRLSIGVFAVLAGQTALLLGHKGELMAAREGKEWWFDSEVSADE